MKWECKQPTHTQLLCDTQMALCLYCCGISDENETVALLVPKEEEVPPKYTPSVHMFDVPVYAAYTNVLVDRGRNCEQERDALINVFRSVMCSFYQCDLPAELAARVFCHLLTSVPPLTMLDITTAFTTMIAE